MPARARLRLGLPARARPRRRGARRSLLLRLEQDRRRAAQVPSGLAVHDRRDPLPGARCRARQIFDEGLDNVFARHAVLARAARAGIAGLGLERFGPDDPDANVVTAARLPDGIDGAAVPKPMRDRYGVTAAGGQGHLKGKIVRIAHCGYYGAFDIVIALSALEMALRDCGYEVEPGAGVAAAQRVFSEAGSPAPVG